MSNIVYDWFAGLATIGGFLYFLTGFFFAYAVHLVRAKVRHRVAQIPWHLAGIAVGVTAILIVSFQSSIAYTTASHTASELQRCNHELLTAINARGKITTENDELSKEQRGLLADVNRVQNQMWARLLNPPPDLAKLPTTDPARQSYGLFVVQSALERTSKIEKRSQQIEDRQVQLAEDRKRHPYPEPTCGT